jgi:deoxyribonuclease V
MFAEAIQLQKELSHRVEQKPLPAPPRFIAGTDVSFDYGSDIHHGVVVVLTYPELQVVERASAIDRVEFPYVPGLLSFREIPLLLKAYQKLAQKPDLIICDGQGITHPRGLGIASHLGLELNIPTIGSAKSSLYGQWEMPGPKKGDRSPILNRKKEVIGQVLRTRDKVSPLFVSIGHLITLEEAVGLVLNCCKKYRVTEPVREAHRFANECRIGLRR